MLPPSEPLIWNPLKVEVEFPIGQDERTKYCTFLYKNVKSDLYARYKAKSVSVRVSSRVKDMPFPFIAATISSIQSEAKEQYYEETLGKSSSVSDNGRELYHDNLARHRVRHARLGYYYLEGREDYWYVN